MPCFGGSASPITLAPPRAWQRERPVAGERGRRRLRPEAHAVQTLPENTSASTRAAAPRRCRLVGADARRRRGWVDLPEDRRWTWWLAPWLPGRKPPINGRMAAGIGTLLANLHDALAPLASLPAIDVDWRHHPRTIIDRTIPRHGWRFAEALVELERADPARGGRFGAARQSDRGARRRAGRPDGRRSR